MVNLKGYIIIPPLKVQEIGKNFQNRWKTFQSFYKQPKPDPALM